MADAADVGPWRGCHQRRRSATCISGSTTCRGAVMPFAAISATKRPRNRIAYGAPSIICARACSPSSPKMISGKWNAA